MKKKTGIFQIILFAKKNKKKKQLLAQLDSSLMKFTIFSSAHQKPLKESEKQLSPPAVEDSASSIDNSSFNTVETAVD